MHRPFTGRPWLGRLFDIVYNVIIYTALIFWLFIIVKSSHDNKYRLSQSTQVERPSSQSNMTVRNKLYALLVVLGNEPLDDNTPTVDTMARVRTAVNYCISRGDDALSCDIIFTGGPTAGKTTEARMMANYAISLGVSPDRIILEEKARSTGENARFVANILLNRVKEAPIRYNDIFIVSKRDHLDWAMSMFKGKNIPGNIFEGAKAMPVDVNRKDSINQMEEYLQIHDSKRVKMRLENLKKGIQGID